MSNKFFLVTTALHESWQKSSDVPILLLGEWCRLFSKKKEWQNCNITVVPYHWDNRRKLYKDLIYINKLYQKLLSHLTIFLNKYHSTQHQMEYWRIIIGPWLSAFIVSLYDKWESINYALNNFNIEETLIIESENSEYVPVCMKHFDILSKSDYWNHSIFSEILIFLGFNKINKLKVNKPRKISVQEKRETPKNKLKNMISKATSLFSRKNDYFFIDTFLKPLDVLKLYLKLRQVPNLHWNNNLRIRSQFDCQKRLKIKSFNPQNKFEEFLKKIIPLQLPIAYCEGFKEIYPIAEKKYRTKSPKVIWTSNSFSDDDVFKVWVAEKVEKNNSILVIGQHGGHYGQGLFSLTEDHELKISALYLSWGWTLGHNNVIPFGRLKRKVCYDNSSNALKMVLSLSGTPRYVEGIISAPLSSQWLIYYKWQEKFYECLENQVSKATVVRLYPNDYDWYQKKRWVKSFPDAIIDNGNESLEDCLETTKLFVSGWNSTTYLESLAANIPTVIFWDEEYFEMNSDASSFFSLLEEAGIYHKTPESAAAHVNSIWNDIDGWWQSNQVVNARKIFTNQYIKTNNTIDDLKNLFIELCKTKSS